ncbi:hypothetical protein [Klebsiella pneumoniae]
MFAGKKSAQIREILISESAWEEMTCLFAPSLVLGGIVAVPIIYFAAKGAWTKARAFQEQEELVEQEHENLRILKPELEKQYNDVLTYTTQLNRHCQV